MNLLNVIVNFYELQNNRKWVPIRMLSPLRFVTRKIANTVLPYYLSRPRKHVFFQLHEKKHVIKKKIIVSLTSFPERINIVWIVVECMLRQSLKPDYIILYLSKKQFPTMEILPESLKERIGDIFQIKIVENDYRSHKKYIYAFRDYPNDIVITVDDDIFYPTTMIEKLVKQYLITPDSVISRYGCRIEYDEKGDLLPYVMWSESFDYRENNFIGSGGGTLFIPSQLYEDVLNVELAQRLCPFADDVWLNAMIRLNHVPIVAITNSLFLPIYSTSKVALSLVNNGQNMNDVQIKDVINYYLNDIGKNPFACDL